ncbi:carbohydrate porin [Dyella humicola]|uniref:carbohydrate porin n=1 Tax=Dyella humicola TaxID=2992126 RepID=UPI0022505EA5|nr:carbohydrate porin [Dyella humicola]
MHFRTGCSKERQALWCITAALAQSVVCASAHTQDAMPAAPERSLRTAIQAGNVSQSKPPLENDAVPSETIVPSPEVASANDQDSERSRFQHWQANNPIGRQLRELKDEGIALNGRYVDNVAANPVGGVKRGSAESHWFELRADIDLDRVAGWTDTRLHIQGADFEGQSLAVRDVGNSVSFQQSWRAVSGWRLTQLNVEHDFGKLNVLVGRAALNSYFNSSPFNCVFMSNTSCLTAYGPIAAIGITAFPNSSWAAKFRYSFDDRTYVQAGVFDYNSKLNLPGKGGVDFSLFQGTGTLVALETGYDTNFANDDYPRRYRLGVDINTDPGISPLYDRHGQPAGISGQPRAEQTGTRMGVYALADQVVWRPDPMSQRNLALFGRAFYNAGAPTAIDSFAAIGLVKTGTFAGRDQDTIGVLVSDVRFSSEELEYLRELRKKAGGVGKPHRDEIIGEVNYGYAVAPGIRVLPNIQFDIHPDSINAPHSKRNIPSAIVVGVRLDIWLAPLFTGQR